MSAFLDPRLPDRFWAKCTPEPNSGCWLWLAASNRDGYGVFSDRLAHRISYAALSKEIGPGLELDHLCRVRSCVNPEHVEPVTHYENTMRGESLAARQARQTHCRRGHEFTEANTLLRLGLHDRRIYRQCHACRTRKGFNEMHWRLLMSSDKLHAADLQGRDADVTIEKVAQGEYTDQRGKKIKKPDLYFRGKSKPLGLNSTNARSIAKLVGSNDTEKWIGKTITIYPTITDAYGEQVECIRIRPRLPANDNRPAANAAANDNAPKGSDDAGKR